jgi:hypothetical protein
VVIRTGFGKNDGAISRISMAVAGPFFGSPASGARPLVHLALDPIEDKGQYFEKLEPRFPSAPAQDDALARALWERSEALVETR